MAKRWISSENYILPVILALAVHVLVFSGFFMVWSTDPEVPEISKPTMIAKLYELNSKSPATTQTSAKLAGEAAKTTAPVSKDDQIATQTQNPKPIVDQAAIDKAEADALAKKQAAEKAKAEALAKKQAEDKAKALAKKQAEDKAKALAKKQAEDKAKADANARKAREDKEAQVLAELLGNKPTIAVTKGDQLGNSVAGSYDDLIGSVIKSNWVEFTNATKGTSVTLSIEMLSDGTITNVKVTRSSGDLVFDNSAITAARNVGRIPEIQQLDTATFNSKYRQRLYVFKAE